MEFEWDEAKHAGTLRDRGIGFDDGARIFAGPVLIWEDARREYGGIAFGRWAKPTATFSMSYSRGAVMHCASSRFGEPIEGKPSYGYD